MIIDAHGHLVPADLIAAIRKERQRFPSLRLLDEGAGLALAFAGGKPSRPIMKGLSDVGARRAWMTKAGIDRQVVGGWPDWFGYELPAAEGEAWCRLFNEAQLAAAKAEGCFVPLASVPMQDGTRAAAVLKAAMAAGFPGVMISTLPRGIGSVLDAADLEPFWEAVDETGAFVHIHPSFDAGDVRVNDYGLANAVGRISDAIVAVARLIASGHVARYRNARIFVPWEQRASHSSLAGSSAITGSRRGSPIRLKASPRSTPTASCTTRVYCALSQRSSAPTAS
jgi:aminocarboxymuconate-semialdehyde decarboxylase